MLQNENDIRKIKGYFESLYKNNNGLNVYTIGEDFNDEFFQKYAKLYKDNDFHTSKDFDLYMISMLFLTNYDLIINTSKDKYNVSTSEKLRVYAKRIALEGNKNVTAAYSYKEMNKQKGIKLYYENPIFSHSDIITVKEKEYNNSYLLDLVSHNHINNNNPKQKIYKKQ